LVPKQSGRHSESKSNALKSCHQYFYQSIFIHEDFRGHTALFVVTVSGERRRQNPGLFLAKRRLHKIRRREPRQGDEQRLGSGVFVHQRPGTGGGTAYATKTLCLPNRESNPVFFRCALLRNNGEILRNIRALLRYFQKIAIPQ